MPPYLVHVRVCDRRPADQLVLLLEELGQLEVESCLDALDGFLVLRPAAAAFHVADDWMQRDNRRPVSPTQGWGARWGWLGLRGYGGGAGGAGALVPPTGHKCSGDGVSIDASLCFSPPRSSPAHISPHLLFIGAM